MPKIKNINRTYSLSQLRRQQDHKRLLKETKKRFRKKDAKILLGHLQTHTVEKDVENAWREAFSKYYVDNSKGLMKMSSPEKCDGYISSSQLSLFNPSNQSKSLAIFNLKILMEFKQQEAYKKMGGGDLRRAINRIMITIQIIHYMKKMKNNGMELPNVLVGADEGEAFVLLASRFYKYLDGDYNWSCSPSSAWTKDPKLFKDLSNDANMNIFPFQFNTGTFNQKYKALLDMFITIDMIGNNAKPFHVPINPSNILDLYSQFCQVAYPSNTKISSVDSVNLFMQLITSGDPTEYYFINGTDIFHLPKDKKVRVYRNQIEALLNKYDRNLKPKEKDELKGIADRLIEAEQRRFKGDFWTPDIWARQADKLMKNVIDPDYKMNSLVWDCAAGVRNLTRDFKYNDLFISTYHPAEILLGKGYNQGSTAFTYDFLNDDVDLNPTDNPYSKIWKMPKNLFTELKQASKTNKRVIFYTNPPFATANNAGAKGNSKKNVAKSEVNKLMKQDGYGAASQQLYAQFMYRVIKLVNDFKLKNAYIAFFSKATLFSGGRYWKNFDTKLFSKFKFIKGFLIRSDEFSGTAGYWPVAFAIYKLRSIPLRNKNKLAHLKFPFNIRKSYLDNNSGKLHTKVISHHTLRTVYNNSLSNWAKHPLKVLPRRFMYKDTYPELSSATKLSKGHKPVGKLYVHSLGYMVLNSNNVAENSNGVWVVSGSAYKGHGMNVMPNDTTFNRAIIAFSARRSIKQNWINDQDKYMKPDFSNFTNKSKFINDCLIYSLFNNASYQASYRNPKYTNTGIKGQWANKWFWLSNDDVFDFANSHNNQTIYNDAKSGSDTYIYKQIKERSFSSEAQKVLQDVTNVWEDTFDLRNTVNMSNPELYLNTWDAGWYQIKQIPQTKHMKSFKQFQKDYKVLNNKIVKDVYKLDMLQK